jgi:Flp pilus assembly protein CpaB
VKRTNRLILVVGILLAVVAFVGIIFVFNQKGPGGQAEIPQANIIVAKRDIKLGDAIQEGDIDKQQIPLSDKRPEYVAQPGDVVGQVARTDIAKGAILTTTMFAGSGQTSISKDLPAGMVAMAVRVDAATGVGTLILPGDRVDVVMTVPFKVTGVPNPLASPIPGSTTWTLTMDPSPSTKMIVQNVEVRAILGATASAAGTSTDGSSGGTAPDLSQIQQTVVLGMTPQQAEVVEFAGQAGVTKQGILQGALFNLTLVLRSPKDKNAPAVETTGVVLQTMMEKYGLLPPIPFEVTTTPRP